MQPHSDQSDLHCWWCMYTVQTWAMPATCQELHYRCTYVHNTHAHNSSVEIPLAVCLPLRTRAHQCIDLRAIDYLWLRCDITISRAWSPIAVGKLHSQRGAPFSMFWRDLTTELLRRCRKFAELLGMKGKLRSKTTLTRKGLKNQISPTSSWSPRQFLQLHLSGCVCKKFTTISNVLTSTSARLTQVGAIASGTISHYTSVFARETAAKMEKGTIGT